MPKHEHIVTDLEQGKRIDTLLATLDDISSRGEAVRLIEEGRVLLNNSRLTAKKRIVLAGDLVEYTTSLPLQLRPQAEYVALDIRYEDEYLMVISKKAGMVVHPTRGHEEGTLVNALIHRYGYENLAILQGDDRPGIVHRLDKDTSGLMLAAKNQQAGLKLQEGIRSRNIVRRYQALVHGYIAPETGLVDAPIARGNYERIRMVIDDGPSSREAITTFAVLDRFEAQAHDDGYTYIECKLHTGRTHQIRVHMEYIGHPCVGDAVYGRTKPAAQMGLERQFLHSWQLNFEHPVSKEAMEFTDDLPQELSSVLVSLDNRRIPKHSKESLV
ncbi:MAG: RluA family pseudouridine synthase [Coriobacteriia bacterium]|nr:RluA family pseudouridine synthase [Coriobacteriia bacterium]